MAVLGGTRGSADAGTYDSLSARGRARDSGHAPSPSGRDPRTRRAPAPHARPATPAGRGSARAATAADPAPPGRDDPAQARAWHRSRRKRNASTGRRAWRATRSPLATVSSRPARSPSSGAPMRPGQQRERRGRGRPQARGVLTGCGHRRASPLRFAEGTTDPHGECRARERHGGAPVLTPLLSGDLLVLRRAAAHVPHRCAQPPERARERDAAHARPDGDLAITAAATAVAGRPRSHRCVVRRGARARAMSTPPPSGRSHQPPRTATAPPRTTRAPAGRVPDSTCSLPHVRAASPASAGRPRRACAAAACRSSRSAAACRPAPAKRSLSAIARHTSVTRAPARTAAGGAPGPLPAARLTRRELAGCPGGPLPGRGRPEGRPGVVHHVRARDGFRHPRRRRAQAQGGVEKPPGHPAARRSQSVDPRPGASCLVDEHEHAGELRGRQRGERQAVRGAGPQHQLNEAMRARHMCAQAENDGRELPVAVRDERRPSCNTTTCRPATMSSHAMVR